MPSPLFNQRLLNTIKRVAKRKSRDDQSLSYNQWLNAESAAYGYATFDSLKRHVNEVEQQAVEAAEWERRFAPGMVWGQNLKDGRTSWPLPIEPGSALLPNSFARSNLFTCGTGPRRQRDEGLFVLHSPVMQYCGEELRVADDEMIFTAMISAIGERRCGELVSFTVADLERISGLPFSEWGIRIHCDAISRTLWRLVHCELTIDRFNFKGPLLCYADARQAPDQFRVRLNPDFANLFYPHLMLFR